MLTVAQLLPELEVGGVERGTVEIARALVARGHRALVVSGGGRLVAELENAGARHFELPIGRKHWSTLRYVGALRELLRQEQVDIVHARSRLPAWVGHLALRGLPAAIRPHWVTTVHGPYSVNRYSRIMVSGGRVIAISEFIRDYILHNYANVDPQRIQLIPRGVDRQRYAYGYEPGTSWRAAWHAEYPQLAQQRLLTLPARLTRWKGQEDFIAVIEQLRGAGHPVHGLVVGGPHPRKQAFADELRRLVTAKGLSAAITFLGHRHDLREILAISALAFSLTREPEAFGRTTIEALSVGTPVVGYAHGGTGEILRSVYPAGLVPIGNLQEVAACAVRILSNGPAVPESHPYTLQRMQAATITVYESLSQRA